MKELQMEQKHGILLTKSWILLVYISSCGIMKILKNEGFIVR